MLASIMQALAESRGEVAGLALTVLLVAAVAWLGRRQEVRLVRRARERHAEERRQRRADWLVLGPPADPWPHADEVEELLRLSVLDVTPAGVR